MEYQKLNETLFSICFCHFSAEHHAVTTFRIAGFGAVETWPRFVLNKTSAWGGAAKNVRLKPSWR